MPAKPKPRPVGRDLRWHTARLRGSSHLCALVRMIGQRWRLLRPMRSFRFRSGFGGRYMPLSENCNFN